MSDEIPRLYYSISEVSEMTGLEAHVLRFWETEFEALQPRKNRAGRRVYTEDDIAVVRRIQHLLREEKYTIEGARQVFARGGEGVATRREALVALRRFLQDLLQRLPEP